SLAAWEKQRKKARSAGERLPKWADWLSGYCGNYSIDMKHALPEKYPGEPWDKRADRLKEAYEDLVWGVVNSKEFLFNH
ncbi:MAG: hypothetical protein ACKO9Q_20345, partial [Pirellula sp.]